MAPPRGIARSVEEHYCRGCGTTTRWRFVRTEHHPAIEYFRCVVCSLERSAYGNVPDSEGLCRAVLESSLLPRSAGHANATGDPTSYDGLDYVDALGSLQLALWMAWTKFEQGYGAGTGSFQGYATMLLRGRLIDWYRRQRVYGPEGRILVSIEALEGTELHGADDARRPGEGGLERALRSLGGNTGPDRSPDLARALARGGRVRDQAV